MTPECRPYLGPMSTLLGPRDAVPYCGMGNSREGKTRRGRISPAMRGIFYENLMQGLALNVPEGSDAERIRFLVSRALISRSQAQRMLKGPESDDFQAPNLDTIAFVAAAFGVSVSEFLRQGCAFPASTPKPKERGLKGALQRYSDSRRTRRFIA